jgi:hypothetical protein
MSGVPVTEAAYTYVNSAALPIAPALSAPGERAVSGTVAPASATLRALQALTGGPTVEVQWAPVDGTTGAFDFSLPIGAPVRTTYVANPVALTFVADPAAAARYTVQASSQGVSKSQDIDVTAPVAPLQFSFP